MTAETEHNDCAVRALAVVCGLTYEQAHYRLQCAGRKNRHRTPEPISAQVYQDMGLRRYFTGGISVSVFLREQPMFTGILHVRGHLFGVVQGNILNDWVDHSSTRIIKDYWTW